MLAGYFSSLCCKNPYGLFVHRHVLRRQVPSKVPGDETNQIPLKTTNINLFFFFKQPVRGLRAPVRPLLQQVGGDGRAQVVWKKKINLYL